jgi:UDP:flavonoid glycosyltransferase YjiC (YdhE family)
MARFLIATLPLAGHVGPGLSIARALARRGHEVRWYTGRRFRQDVEATGAGYVPMVAAPDPGDGPFFAPLPKLSRLRAANWGLMRAFIDTIPAQVADLRRALDAFPADVILGDQVFGGAEAFHELGGPPWAMLSVSALTLSSRDTAPATLALPPNPSRGGRLRNRALNAVIHRGVTREAVHHLRYVRWTLGLPPLRRGLFDMLSPYLYLHGGTPAFEYPRSDLPPQVHFVGPLLPEPPHDFAPPPWWGELRAGRPVVHVTQGTVATEAEQLILPTLRALADDEVLVVATTGGKALSGLPPGKLPANARPAPWLPHARLLPHVDVMVTNGGYGGVQAALAHGVPLAVAGATEEKPQIAALVAWSGAGVNLRTGTPAPAQIGAAVRALLSDPRYRQQARRIQADYAQHRPAEEAAALLERLAATGRPVLREPGGEPASTADRRRPARGRSAARGSQQTNSEVL